METQIDHLRDFANFFKDIIFTLGIIIGGIWAYFKFRKLNVYKESILKIEELEKKLKEQPIVQTSIEASFKILGNDKYIIGEVLMINSGNRNTFLDFNDSICTASEVSYNEVEKNYFGKEFSGYINYDTYVLKAGNQINIPFIIKVDNADIYLIDFWINVPKKELKLYREIYNDLGVRRKAETVYWGTQKYIVQES